MAIPPSCEIPDHGFIKLHPWGDGQSPLLENRPCNLSMAHVVSPKQLLPLRGCVDNIYTLKIPVGCGYMWIHVDGVEVFPKLFRQHPLVMTNIAIENDHRNS